MLEIHQIVRTPWQAAREPKEPPPRPEPREPAREPDRQRPTRDSPRPDREIKENTDYPHPGPRPPTPRWP